MINESMFTSVSQDWCTPPDLYEELDKIYKFDLDPCASVGNAKCPYFFTKEEDGLSKDWGTCNVFCNPPYKDIAKWIEKAYNESLKGALVVMLIPARSDTRWFKNYATKGEIRFISGRLKFSGHKNSAPFPSMLVIFNKNYRPYMGMWGDK
jgi:site-specific DNA-methyltransferase (adenine-specific)